MIYLFDWQSLYPHCFMGGNLYSPCSKHSLSIDGWNGTDIYPNQLINDEDGIVGTYKREPGKIEQVIQWLFNQRKTFPKSDPRNLAYKIVLNTIYGISGCAKFESVYNLTTASDCTALARRTIKFTRKMFELNGYEVIYTDTDSVFVKDHNKEKDFEQNRDNRILKIAEFISERCRRAFNIKIPTHNLVFETKILRMYFFRNDDNKFIKKHYIYINYKNEIIIKGLKIKQGNCSKLAKLFFDTYMKSLFINNLYKPYKSEELLKELKQFSIGKEDLLTKRFRVNSLETYKILNGKDEATGMAYQISKRYGQGEHYLIPNKRIGVGKGIKYAKIEELKEKYGDYWLDQVVFEQYLKDLSEFIIVEDRNKITKIDRKRINHNETNKN